MITKASPTVTTTRKLELTNRALKFREVKNEGAMAPDIMSANTMNKIGRFTLPEAPKICRLILCTIRGLLLSFEHDLDEVGDIKMVVG